MLDVAPPVFILTNMYADRTAVTCVKLLYANVA